MNLRFLSLFLVNFLFYLLQNRKVRNYENNFIYSHVLGYVGYKNDLKEQKLNNLKFGISGLEKTFDKKL